MYAQLRDFYRCKGGTPFSDVHGGTPFSDVHGDTPFSGVHGGTPLLSRAKPMTEKVMPAKVSRVSSLMNEMSSMQRKAR